MILITKEQAEYLRSVLPDILITKTCKKKSKAKRGKRYVEESKKVVMALARFGTKKGVM